MAEEQAPAAQPTPGRDVFISYASHDKAVAESVCKALEDAGIVCWIAPRDVVPGESFAGAIVHAIDATKVTVLVLSEHAATSQHVLREVERASSKRHPVIAFRIDLAPMAADFEYFLNTSQWLDASTAGVKHALPKLVDATRSALALPKSAAHITERPAVTASLTRRPTRLLVALAAVIVAALGYVVADKVWLSNHSQAQKNVVYTAAVASASAPLAAAPEKSIAVLPFTDMSEKKDQEYFSDGIADEVLNLLARVPGIRVIGRTSSFQFKGKSEDLRAIGAKLGSAYVVEGSVRKSSELLRVAAQLVVTRDGSQLWSEIYEAAPGELFHVQDQIAAALVRALQVTIGADDLRSVPAKNPEAYDLYLRGRHSYDRFDQTGFESAASYFQQALVLDPDFVRAAEWLSLTHEAIAEWGFAPSRVGFERARVSTLHALALNPRSALAHMNMCAIHTLYDWDWAAAARECQIALDIEPYNSLALATAGQTAFATDTDDKGARLLIEALTLDPMVASSHVLLGNSRRRVGRYAEAEAEFRKALAISPQYVAGHFYLALALLEQGRMDEARLEMQREVSIGGRDVGLAIVDFAKGNKRESDLDLARTPDDWPYEMAGAYAYRGDTDRAMKLLERAYREKDVDLCFIRSEPLFARIATDSRFKALLRKMNLLQ
jgi:TolB-like protein